MKICAKNEHIFKRYQNIDIFLNAIMILIVRKEDEIVQIINT